MPYRTATNSALTEETVARIKGLLTRGHTPKELGQAYGLATETIRRMGRGETWAWVSPDDTAESMEQRVDRGLGTDLALEQAREQMKAQGIDPEALVQRVTKQQEGQDKSLGQGLTPELEQRFKKFTGR